VYGGNYIELILVSFVDYETDSVIQTSLRHRLGGDVTLFTIAHRLQTIVSVSLSDLFHRFLMFSVTDGCR
jgi:phage-related holin